MDIKQGSQIGFSYTNWRGIGGYREVSVRRIYFGSNQWHKKPQWLMEAFDLSKRDVRHFAMKDMWNVEELKQDETVEEDSMKGS